MAWPDRTNEVIVSVGATARTHSTIAAWEADTDDDCTAGWGAGIYAAACCPVGDCYKDAVFSETVSIQSATSSDNYFRTLQVHSGQGHDGTAWGGGVTINQSFTEQYLQDQYVVVDGFLHTGSSYAWRIQYGVAGGKILVKNLVCDETVLICDVVGYKEARNCMLVATDLNIVRGFTKAQNVSVLLLGTSNYTRCFLFCECNNCIGMVDDTPGVDHEGYDVNCTGDYNIDSYTDVPGAHSVSSIDPEDIYTDIGAGQEDLHLKSDSTAASDAGTDLSGVTYGFDDDIDGDTRSDWDIGADEYVAAGGGLAVAVVALLIQRQNKRKNSLIGR